MLSIKVEQALADHFQEYDDERSKEYFLNLIKTGNEEIIRIIDEEPDGCEDGECSHIITVHNVSSLQ